MLSPLLSRPGAVAARGVDAAVADHYGDPLREQRRLIETGAVVDRSHRGVLRVSGPDRLSWLHSLLTQHVSDLAPGQAVQALSLSPHGHVEHHMVLADDGEATWIDVEPGTVAALSAYLMSMQFMLRVEVADCTAEYGLVTVVGEAPVSGRVLPWGTDLLVPRASLAEVVDSTGLPLVGHGAFEAVRVAEHRPRLGFETDHRSIPHEIGWLDSAVHLQKGCYRGQETVARVNNLGRPPRRLVMGHLDGTQDELPPAHTPVELDGKAVGFLGTAVHHAELGPVCLAVIKRSMPDDAHFTVAGMAMKAERVVDA